MKISERRVAVFKSLYCADRRHWICTPVLLYIVLIKRGLGLQRWLSARCSCRGPGIHSQNPHGISEPSVIPVPENLTPSPDLLCTPAYIWCI